MVDHDAPAVIPYRGISRLEEWPELTPAQQDHWNRYLAKLQRTRDESGERFAAAREAAFRAAALDSGALEGLVDTDPGFTMTVATQAAAWQQMMDERGEGQRATFEDQLRAFELVLDLATESRPVTESFVRQLHEVACASQATHRVLTAVGWQERELPRGRYKDQPNNPLTVGGAIHEYAPPEETAREMADLVETLRGSAFARAHPLIQAAYAHHSFVTIHPFPDGNGRVARALGSVYVVRAASIPLVIFADQRSHYLRALRQADVGVFAEWIGFLLERLIEGVNFVDAVMRASDLGPAAERLRKIFHKPAGLARAEVDELARRVMEEAGRLLLLRFERNFSIPEIQFGAIVGVDGDAPVAGFRRISMNRHNHHPVLIASMKCSEPKLDEVKALSRPLVAESEIDGLMIKIQGLDHSYELEVRLDEVHPRILPSLAVRIELWADGVLATLSQRLAPRIEKAFEKLR